MGHLINPIAMRVGFFSYWEDFWYVDFVYYPEFFHLIMKIKSFFIFFFGFRFVEISGFLYSHFILFKHFKFIIVRVFFFNGVLDEHIEDFFLNCWKFFFEDEFFIKNKGKFFPSPSFINKFRLLMLFRLVSFFSIKRLLKGLNIKIKQFLYFFKNLNYKRLWELYLKSNLNKVRLRRSRFYVGEKARFLFIFFVFLKMLNMNKVGIGKSYNIEIEYTFIKVLFLDMFFSRVFKYLDKFLSSFIISCFFSFSFFRSEFFVLRNEDINAKFLSRYIARKLQQGYKFRKVVNPIKNELKKLIALFYSFSGVNNNDIGNINGNNNLFNVDSNFLKGFFVRLINFSSFFCRIEFFKFYKNNYSWFSLDLLVLFYHIRKFLKSIESLIGLSLYIFIYLFSFIFFFNSSIVFDFFFYNKKLDFLFFNIKKLDSCLNAFILSIYSSNNLFFEYSSSFLNNFFFLKVSNFFINSYIKYGYCLFLRHVSSSLLKSNKKNAIVKNIFPGFFGFRMKFKGRFSRRQKASSILYSVGNIPLTRLNANIDYSFYTIPLKNSAISVKIWLHKNLSYNEMDIFRYRCL